MLSKEAQVDVTLGLWKNIGVTSVLFISMRSLGSKHVRVFDSAGRPNVAPGRGSSQWLSPCEGNNKEVGAGQHSMLQHSAGTLHGGTFLHFLQYLHYILCSGVPSPFGFVGERLSYHYSSSLCPLKVHRPSGNILAQDAASAEFCLRTSSLRFRSQSLSLYLDMKIVRPLTW